MQPSLLLLDEPTSSLDAHAQLEVQKGLDALMAGRTVLRIEHGQNAARTADQVVLLDAGTVARSGAPRDVLPG